MPAAAPRRSTLRRVAFLAVGVASLVLLRSTLTGVYAETLPAVHVPVVWLVAALACEFLGFASTWWLQRTALRAGGWFDVAAPHLVGNAVSNVVPAGSELGAVAQFRLLGRRGYDVVRSVTALTAVALMSGAVGAVVFPLVLLAGRHRSGFDAGAVPVALGGVIAVPVALAVLCRPRVVGVVARAVERTATRLPMFRARTRERLAERIVDEHRAVTGALRARTGRVVLASIGRAAGDFLALYAALLGAGVRPSPATVLLAFGAANLAGMVPFTPGGVGFVEAGLAGTLTMSGVATTPALVGVAVYRLVSCWIPVLLGAGAYGVLRMSETRSADPGAALTPELALEPLAVEPLAIEPLAVAAAD